jgi:diguanylate cyclase (GGDEF)-like protein/PAS domain S-box-containing protein
MLLVSEAGIVRAASGALARLVGHDPETAVGRPLTDLLVESDRPAAERALAAAAAGQAGVAEATTVEVGLRHRSEDLVIPFELHIVNLLQDPTVGGFVVSGHDLTSRKVTEGRLLTALSLLHATLDSTSDGIYVVDRNGRMTLANRQFLDLWQIPEEVMATGDMVAARAHAIAQLTDPQLFETTAAQLSAHPDATSHDVLRFTDGRVYERRSQPQYVDGEIVGRVWSLHDATEQTRLEEQLAHQALHDSLTALANQSLFRDRVNHALTRLDRTRGHLAVLFLDLDNFKTVNDSLGHSAGDLLLVEVAARLQSCLRSGDTAARLGGDEFAVLLEDLASDGDAVVLAERVIRAFEQTFTVEGTEVSATVSVGIACASPASSTDQLLRNADLAMYTAKRAGKGRFEIYEGTMHAAAVKRLYAEAELRRAIESHELRPHYQPIVDLTTGETVSLEALARWQHPDRGVLSAAEFIPLAEETGLVSEISRLVLETACADLRAWRDAGEVTATLSMSVNLGARQLSGDALIAQVAAALDTYDLEPSCLILEITESAMMVDTAAAMETLSRLRALGVKIALDDFGTGYSSLSYLQRFPVDILKIDKSFVDGLDSTPELSALPQAIIALAKTLGLTSIAEGIEREAQRAHLCELGCHLGQGYLFAAPVPAEAIPALVAAG